MLPLMQSGIRMKTSCREPYPHFYVNNIGHAELKHFIGRWMFKEMFHNCHHVDWNELSYTFYESPWFISLLIRCATLPLYSSRSHLLAWLHHKIYLNSVQNMKHPCEFFFP